MDIKNPRLLLAGAAIGAYTQDPTDNPIAGVMGLGIGAFVGNAIQMPDRITTTAKKLIQASTGRAVDDIKVDLSKVGPQSKKAVSEKDIVEDLSKRSRRYRRVVKDIERLESEHFAKTLYGSGISESDFPVGLTDYRRLRELASTSEDFDKDLVEEFSSYYKIRRNGGDEKIRQALSSASAFKNASIDSYFEAVEANFQALKDQSIYDILPNASKDTVRKLISGQELSKEEIDLILSSDGMDKDFLSALRTAADERNIEIDKISGTYSKGLYKFDKASLESAKTANSGSYLNLLNTISDETKVTEIKNYLVSNLGNTPEEAERIAQNITTMTKHRDVVFSGSQVSIGVPGDMAKIDLVKRDSGKQIIQRGASVFSPYLSNPFATMTEGQDIGVRVSSNSSSGTVLDRGLKMTAFTPVESALMESHLTGKRLQDVYEESYSGHTYLGPEKGIRESGVALRRNMIDYGRHMKSRRDGSIYYTDGLSEKEFDSVLRDHAVALRNKGESSNLFIRARGDIDKIAVPGQNFVLAGNGYVSSRSVQDLNRGTTARVSMPDTPVERAAAERMDYFIRAAEELDKDRLGGAFVGAVPTTVSTISEEELSGVGHKVYNTTLGDGQTIHNIKGLTSNIPMSITLGPNDFVANSEQMELLERIKSGESVTVKAGQLFGYSASGKMEIPEYVDDITIHGMRVENNTIKFDATGTTRADVDRIAGVKFFGDVKSSSQRLLKEDRAKIEFLNKLGEIGAISYDDKNGYVRLSKSAHTEEARSAINFLRKYVFRDGKDIPLEEAKRAFSGGESKLLHEKVEPEFSPVHKLYQQARVKAFNSANISGRKEDFKGIAKAEDFLNLLKDDRPESKVELEKLLESRFKSSELYDEGVQAVKERPGAAPHIQFQNIFKSLKNKEVEPGVLKAYKIKALSAAIAYQSMIDGKSANLYHGTFVNEVSKLHQKMVEMRQSSMIKVKNHEGQDVKIKLGIHNGEIEDPVSAIKGLLINMHNINNAGISGRISQDAVFQSHMQNLEEVLAKNNELGIRSELATLSVMQGGNDAVTGAKEEGSMSWLGRQSAENVGVSNATLRYMGTTNQDAAFELRARALQYGSGDSIVDVLGDDPTEAASKLYNLMFSDGDRREYAKNHLGNAIDNEGVISFNLEKIGSKDMDPKGKMKSISIGLVNTDMSGILTLPNGMSAKSKLDSYKYDAAVAMYNYAHAEKHGTKEEIDQAAIEYRKMYDRWAKLDRSTSKNLSKEAAKIKYNRGAYVALLAANASQQLIIDAALKKKSHTVFVNEETARALGFMDESRYGLDNTSQRGIQKVVMNEEQRRSAMSIMHREPAAGPLSTMPTEIYIDRNLNPKGLAATIDSTVLAAISADHDGDKITLGMLEAGEEGFEDAYANLRGAMKSHAGIITEDLGLIRSLNAKMSGTKIKMEKEASLASSAVDDAIDDIGKGMKRDKFAAGITEIQQMLMHVANRRAKDQIAKIESDTKLSAEMKSRKLAMIEKERLGSLEMARGFQENVLKSVRTGGTGGASLLEIITNLRAKAGINKNANYSDVANAIYKSAEEIFLPLAANEEEVTRVRAVAANLRDAVSQYGASVSSDINNMVGSTVSNSDHIQGARKYVESTEDRAASALEGLSPAKQANTIDEVEDGLSYAVRSIKQNKTALGLGFGALALTALATQRTPNPSSPMYNSPTARTQGTLPPLEDKKAYIGQYNQEPRGAIQVVGYTAEGYARSLDSRINGIRYAIEGDRNSRSTVRFEHQNY